jgi:hypothetical protein
MLQPTPSEQFNAGMLPVQSYKRDLEIDFLRHALTNAALAKARDKKLGG